MSARIEAGELLRQLQRGILLSLPHSRPMPSIGQRCRELRIRVESHNWRIIYRADEDAIVILEVFDKKARTTPDHVVQNCQRRMKQYDTA